MFLSFYDFWQNHFFHPMLVNTFECQAFLEIHHIFNEKEAYFQISRRRFNEIETSPIGVKSIFMQDLPLNKKTTPIWSKSDKKSLSFDDSDNRCNSRTRTYIHFLGTRIIKLKFIISTKVPILA